MGVMDEGPNTGHFDIITDNVIRDPKTEQRIMELNVRRNFLFMILVGSILLFLALIW